jgi:hypothetical protein
MIWETMLTGLCDFACLVFEESSSRWLSDAECYRLIERHPADIYRENIRMLPPEIYEPERVAFVGSDSYLPSAARVT